MEIMAVYFCQKRMHMDTLKIIACCFLILGCTPTKSSRTAHSLSSEHLVIRPISAGVFQHISYLNTDSFGKVECNGMIVTDKDEAVIFDTPSDIPASLELINWVEKELGCKVIAVIPTHFHSDCLGGLEAFHDRNIPSFAHHTTISLASAKELPIPKIGFDSLLELPVGNKKVLAEFLGEGHTQDNIIGYFPEEKIMFGGCLVKEIGAGKGNLEDANVAEWPQTMAKIQKKYPDTRLIVPGHGKSGGGELLDYTAGLFEQQPD